MAREAVGRTTDAGFFTSATIGAGLVYTNGSIGNDLTTGELPDDLATQTVNTLDRLKKILEDAGTDVGKILKVNVFLDDIEADFDEMNEVYAKYFADHGVTEPPARTTVGCRLPWSKVEMNAIAVQS